MNWNSTPVKNSKAPLWLWLIWLIAILDIFFSYRLLPDNIATWVQAAGIITALICTVIVKEKYDKDDRLAAWIEGGVKKLVRRSK